MKTYGMTRLGFSNRKPLSRASSNVSLPTGALRPSREDKTASSWMSRPRSDGCGLRRLRSAMNFISGLYVRA
jgi:hypothetical protein